nr:MAG TPA: hypothetical protein [Caudoviricetes sp.]
MSCLYSLWINACVRPLHRKRLSSVSRFDQSSANSTI